MNKIYHNIEIMISQLGNIILCYSITLRNVNAQYISKCFLGNDGSIVMSLGLFNWRRIPYRPYSKIIYKYGRTTTKFMISSNY